MGAEECEEELQSTQVDATQLLFDPTLVLEDDADTADGAECSGEDFAATQILHCSADDFAATQILHHSSADEHNQNVPLGASWNSKKTASDATTVQDEPANESAAAFQDSASSKHHIEEEELDLQVQATQILDSQPEREHTQILTQMLPDHPGLIAEEQVKEVPKKKFRDIASVRVQSLRRSAFAAYEKLVAQIEKDPEEPLEDSAEFVLEWGRKQNLPGPKMITRAHSIVEENRVLGEASCSASLVTTPVSQPLKNIAAMCSNNKRTTGDFNLAVDAVSPLKPESNLDRRVRKVLFEELKAPTPREDHQPQRLDITVGVVQQDEPVKKASSGNELSYLNSQEPGEESQANALEALDNFVSLNCADFSQEAQVNEFHVESKKTPGSHVEQLQKKESASVFDFVTSQQDPLMGSLVVEEQKQEVVKDVAAQDDEQEKDSDEVMKTVVKKKPRSTTKPPSKSTGKTPTTKRKAQISPEKVSGRGKRGKHATSKGEAHPVLFAASPGEASPATPKNASEEAKNTVPKSTNKKRKALSEKLILEDDTPRRCRRKPVKILFSHSLDKETVAEQKKIMKTLNFQEVTKASVCTHFVTDRFLRTANMLEVLAAGKPVVSIAWLESCSVAECAVDEKKFILEDSRKEKEVGFSMNTTFGLAQQKLLLEGMKFFITPNTKPDVVAAVVRAAGGKIVRKYDEKDENCFVISCEEDHKSCLPFLDRGVKIFSTEFLFSGIVSYHLDFSKNLLFSDHDPVV